MANSIPIRRPDRALVEVTRVRSRSVLTDPDQTAPTKRPPTVARGHLAQLRVDAPMIIVDIWGGRWATSKVQAISESTGLAEVTTERTVYRVRWI